MPVHQEKSPPTYGGDITPASVGDSYLQEEMDTKDPLPQWCYSQLKSALRYGRIERKDHCEECGIFGTNAHHEDYKQPLMVAWLCTKHHAARHREHKTREARQARSDPVVNARLAVIAANNYVWLLEQEVKEAEQLLIETVRRARAVGCTLREIAAEARVTHETIRTWTRDIVPAPRTPEIQEGR